MKIRCGFATLIAITLLGCKSSPLSQDPGAETSAFFDVQGYFQNEVERLRKEAPDARKNLSLNGKEDSMTPDSLDYEKELSVFLNSDINKVAWKNQYQADSTFSASGQLVQARYEALVDKLRTRLVEVSYKNGIPSKIFIVNRTENVILDARQELTYQPGQGFSIRQKQQMRFMKPNYLAVDVAFL